MWCIVMFRFVQMCSLHCLNGFNLIVMFYLNHISVETPLVEEVVELHWDTDEEGFRGDSQGKHSRRIYNIDQLDAEEEYHSSDHESGDEDVVLSESEVELNRVSNDEHVLNDVNFMPVEGDVNHVGEGSGNIEEHCPELEQEWDLEIGEEDEEFISRTSNIAEDEGVPQEGENRDGVGLKLEVGMKWEDVHKCREWLTDYSVEKRFILKLKKNDSNKLIAICETKKDGVCKWRAYIRRLNDNHTMRCNKLQPLHLCSSDILGNNPKVNAPWIARKIEQLMRVHHMSLTPQSIVAEIWSKYALNVKYWQAWNARGMALALIHGNYEEGYAKVPELCKQVHKSNPNSIATFSRDDTYKSFTSCCIALKACLDGFVSGCRPLIGLDGCFLKGKYGGVVLSVVALDGNNGMFPLAIFVCRKEDRQNWQKFLEILKPELDKHPGCLTIMSDRQKGLRDAVTTVFPECNQRFCFRHMYKNMKLSYRGLESLVWGAARAFKKTQHDHFMAQLHEKEPGASAYLLREDQKVWARSHFDHDTKSDHVTNNFSEAWNSYILKARDKPLLGLIAKVQTLQMKLIYDRKQKVKTWDENGLVPRVYELIDRMRAKTHKYSVGGASDHTFQVSHEMGYTWVVDLHTKTCTCNQWQVSGIPCIHAICVIIPNRLPLEE